MFFVAVAARDAKGAKGARLVGGIGIGNLLQDVSKLVELHFHFIFLDFLISGCINGFGLKRLYFIIIIVLLFPILLAT